MYIYKYRYEFLNNAYIFVVSFDLCPPNQPQHTPRRIYRPRFSRQTSDPLTYCVVHLNTAFLTILRRKTKEKRKTRNDTHTHSAHNTSYCVRVCNIQDLPNRHAFSFFHALTIGKLNAYILCFSEKSAKNEVSHHIPPNRKSERPVIWPTRMPS